MWYIVAMYAVGAMYIGILFMDMRRRYRYNRAMRELSGHYSGILATKRIHRAERRRAVRDL